MAAEEKSPGVWLLDAHGNDPKNLDIPSCCEVSTKKLYAGYGIIVNAHECNLKYQNLSSANQSAISVWSRGSATPFSSGVLQPCAAV